MEKTLVLNSPFLTREFSLKIGFKNFLTISFLSVLILLILFLFQLKILFFQNYQIKEGNQKLNQLSKENEILEIALSKNSSLENLEAKFKELGFEKIEKMRFLLILEDQIVTK